MSQHSRAKVLVGRVDHKNADQREPTMSAGELVERREQTLRASSVRTNVLGASFCRRLNSFVTLIRLRRS